MNLQQLRCSPNGVLGVHRNLVLKIFGVMAKIVPDTPRVVKLATIIMATNGANL